jgi:hypothetical protein
MEEMNAVLAVQEKRISGNAALIQLPTFLHVKNCPR